MTENELRFERLLKPATINGNEEVLVAHAWLHVDNDMLDAPIPSEKLAERWGEDGLEATLYDFALATVPVDATTSLLMLSACDKGGSRKSYTSADDLAVWVTEVEPFGYDEGDLLTDEEAMALITHDGEG